MLSSVNVLIVDDEQSWRELYEDEVRRISVGAIRSVENLRSAEKAVEEMCFGVAIVDVGLDENDDRNVDGLMVMRKIRDVGDRTSIIVVSGRSGRDVLSIVRDAMKTYGAFDAVAKGTVVPADLRKLVESGIQAYRDASSDDRRQMHDAARGDMPMVLWDDYVMRGTTLRGGVVSLHAALEGLLLPFGPLVPGDLRGVRVLDGLACGPFWSRGIGRPIVACFGSAEGAAAAVATAKSGGVLLESYRVAEILQDYRAEGTYGAVFALSGGSRRDYGV
jgi:FixJ family two-component response regulator